MQDIRIEVNQAESSKDVTIIRLSGVIDTNTSRHLNKTLSELIGSGQYKLVIDLSDVSYISSAGWGIFIGEIRTIQTHHGDLKLAALSAEVEEVYQLLEFYNILKAYDSVEEAIEDFKSP